jgi:SAM-dependent methyltransferase
MLEVIEHIPHKERDQVARECMRVLRPGGVLIVATPNRLFPIDEHGGRFGRWHSPFFDDTVSTRELEMLFRSPARTLSWKNYFAFQMIPAARYLQPLMPFFDLPWVHRSPFNPHLFVAFTRSVNSSI